MLTAAHCSLRLSDILASTREGVGSTVPAPALCPALRNTDAAILALCTFCAQQSAVVTRFPLQAHGCHSADTWQAHEWAHGGHTAGTQRSSQQFSTHCQALGLTQGPLAGQAQTCRRPPDVLRISHRLPARSIPVPCPCSADEGLLHPHKPQDPGDKCGML